jgi:GNAT superfamily N-acetyltransferase
MQIRTAQRRDCQRLGEVLVSATRSAFEGRVPERCLLDLPVEESAANWRRFFDSGDLETGDESLLVAETDLEGVVGLVLAGRRSSDVIHDAAIASRYPREVSTLQVAPDWQKRGVGRRLLQAVADWLATSRERTLAVRVLEPNPNRAFYERLGAHELGSQPYDWTGFSTREMIYGWPDISHLRSPEGR